MMYEQCCTCPELAVIERRADGGNAAHWHGQRRRVPDYQALADCERQLWRRADDTPEPGNTSGPGAMVRLPDEPRDCATFVLRWAARRWWGHPRR